MRLDLNQITILVTDVEKSMAFYEKLGLKLIVKSLPHYARFECIKGETTLSLHKAEAGPAGTGAWIYFETENLDHDVDDLIRQGIGFEEMPNDKPWRWRDARLKDPDRHQLILYYAADNRRNPPWRLR